MKATAVLKACALSLFCLLSALSAPAALADASPAAFSLAGTWTLVAADVLHADGTRTRDYGAAPKGLLMIDALGRYSLQIFKAERPRFASGDKATGTPAEYEAAVMGSSTHFGTISIDPAAGTLTFHIESASFPNWEGVQQQRHYELKDDVLTYRVPPRPNGDTPVSVWRRLK
ncbi:lipocalin-like domain-containing protein [Telmatospirillum sp.]|uniref:lipocalin-like domain-containing protein n=1 Tax=Telmatospirillum sp. TaxID=2079197 RepID=UPI00284E4D4B|nr:lipocalin-like domain-containing protein [Telmatospirillum sp.]MDR3436598.1 lipocalin-like domain-containing protein [Telmatospirillum sp.]